MVCAFEERSFILDVKCWNCGMDYAVIINKEDLLDWAVGEGSIQDIFHYLTAGERELLLSNTCGNCFDALYGAESELDNDD
jgi:hypothetical protein